MIIREIKNKINILNNINKLTNTLSMISLSKINKYSKQLIVLNNLNLEMKNIFLELYNSKKTNKFCCILITTNKGLCGNMNFEAIKKCLNLLKNNKNIDLIIIGKKAIDYFNKKNFFIVKKIIFLNEKIENVFFTKEVIDIIKQYENVYFVSSKIIKNSIKTVKTNLFENKKKSFYEKKIFSLNFILENYINYTLKNIFNENFFCELKLRMITMKSASDNSKKIIKDMKIIKNKIRQFKVTQEILEIINGGVL